MLTRAIGLLIISFFPFCRIVFYKEKPLQYQLHLIHAWVGHVYPWIWLLITLQYRPVLRRVRSTPWKSKRTFWWFFCAISKKVQVLKKISVQMNCTRKEIRFHISRIYLTFWVHILLLVHIWSKPWNIFVMFYSLHWNN